MKDNLILKYVSTALRVLMTLLVMLLVIAFAQAVIPEITMVLAPEYGVSAWPQRAVEDELTRIRRSYKYFMSDGTVHQMEFINGYFQRDDKDKKIRIYDVNDKLLWEGLGREMPYEYLSWAGGYQEYPWSITEPISFFDNESMNMMLTVSPEGSRSIEIPIRQEGEVKMIWRFVPDKNYFVGYDADGHTAGYLGAGGFAKDKSDVKDFGQFGVFTAWCPTGSINPVMLWKTDKRIYQIDFQKQTVELIFESDKKLKPQMSLRNWKFEDRDNIGHIRYRPAILCETVDEEIKLVMRQPEQVFTFSPPEDWDLKEHYVKLTATNNGIYVLRGYNGPRIPEEYRYSEELLNRWLREHRAKPLERWVELYRVCEGGKMSLMDRYEWAEPPRKVLDIKAGFVGYVRYYTTGFSPPVYTMLWQVIGKYHPKSFRSANDSIFSLWVAIIRVLHSRHQVFNWCLSCLMVFVALWHGYSRRANWVVMIVWLVIVAMFNLAGLLTYLALNHTAVVKCPVCGRKRGLEATDCVRCGAALPEPELRDADRVLITKSVTSRQQV